MFSSSVRWWLIFIINLVRFRITMKTHLSASWLWIQCRLLSQILASRPCPSWWTVPSKCDANAFPPYIVCPAILPQQQRKVNSLDAVSTKRKSTERERTLDARREKEQRGPTKSIWNLEWKILEIGADHKISWVWLTPVNWVLNQDVSRRIIYSK